MTVVVRRAVAQFHICAAVVPVQIGGITHGHSCPHHILVRLLQCTVYGTALEVYPEI